MTDTFLLLWREFCAAETCMERLRIFHLLEAAL